MTLSNATLARAVLAVIRATEDTPTLPMILRSKDFRMLAASIAALPEINDVEQLRALTAQVRQDFDLTEYERRLLALRDEALAAQKAAFSRTEMVLLHTLCGARASQIEPFTQSDTNYKAELLALRGKIDTLLTTP